MDVAKEIHAKGGVKGFYAGLDSALLRQVVYGTLRLGIYSNCIDYFKKQNADPTTTTFMQKAQSSFIAGSVGSWFGNPCDLVLVRMQADTSLPVNERRNYKGVGDAFRRIMAEEGLTAYWVGAVPTMIRATALNMSMMMTYDTVKENLTKAYPQDPFKVQVASSMLSAINVALITLPFDNIKTKIQKQKPLPDGTMPYKNFMDCFRQSMVKEGAMGFWSGLPTFYFRVGPHAIITLLALEQWRSIMGVGK